MFTDHLLTVIKKTKQPKKHQKPTLTALISKLCQFL